MIHNLALQENKKNITLSSYSNSGTALHFGKCERQEDGRVDMSDCSFLEYLEVAWDSAWNCEQPEAGASKAKIDEYYDCVQAQVCSNC